MRILVTEDDPILAPMLKEALTHQHHVVDIAGDGQMGWEYADALTYDLILLDIDLPKLDGINLCRRLRQQGYEGAIILLTGRHQSTDKVTGLDAGADDYVVKPCTLEELNARIRAVMRRRQTYAQSVLVWGDLCLNPKTCEVTYQEEPLSLSAKEYGLLELFLRHPERIFSSSSILDYLWSFPDSPGEETVRAHVKRLRRKLKDVGAEGIIETIYGMGYRMKALPPKASEKEIPPPLEDREPDQSETPEAQTQAAIAQLWESFKGPILERLALLEDVITAVEQGKSSEDNRQEGQQAAHKLVGSLGMFGYPQGSEIARSMETIFQSDRCRDKGGELRSHLKQLQALLIPPEPKTEVRKKERPDFPDPENSNLPAPLVVLAVDDDPLIHQRLTTCLPPWGINITPLGNPHNFWATLKQVQPHLLILDIDMPDITGLDLCEQVRNHPDWNSLPILFLTSYNDPETINRLYALGADDYVNKTATDSELVTRILNRLERHQLLHSRLNLSPQIDPQDELTQVMRRYPAWTKLEHQLERCHQDRQSLAIILLDIDRFRQINQQGGYRVGDLILQNIAQILRQQVPPETLIVRWGDDQFLLAVPRINHQQTEQLIQTILAEVTQIDLGGLKPIKITLSSGYAQFPDSASGHEHAQELEQLCQQAEKAMNLARKNGES
ncbi:response regulator [Roseofilum sp. BLCC_M154]|uniref:Response regulator n=1 Tax=Roseofilum acuticapitatum BLCC-M154 TaxID=3022444 RepID=A0ABT7AUA5_9CYAN|nr:response regulator [Roseofilum acuticapitatum]MDJ1170493.1 response regulator [Roseofilum acuticapitatum BLCC-M154]